jgi:hypothetical protein
MNQNIFCSKCHRIPSQCCCSSTKELTDEEIANVWNDVRKDATLKSSMKDIQEFARAILKKASEK